MSYDYDNDCKPLTSTNTRALRCLCVLSCCLLSQPLLAQDEADERSWSLGLALGHGERDNPLVSGKSININAVVDLSWYGERFFFDNGDFGFTLRQQNTWSLSLVSTFNNDRYYYNYLSGNSFGLDSILDNRFGLAGEGSTGPVDDEKPPRSEALLPDSIDITKLSPEELNHSTELADRNFALNSGLEFLYISPFGDIQAQVLTDISSTHNGHEAWLSWSKPWYTRNSEFTLTLGMEWKSHQLIGYYYGVLPQEAFAGRAKYDGAAGTNQFVRFAARHRINQRWSLVGMVEREFLSDAISASPIVDDPEADTVFAGLFYQF